MEGQAGYLAGFVSDLESGRYTTDETVSEAAVAARAALYAGPLINTANEAWAGTLPETTLYYWHLGGADHCGDCPGLETNSPYTAATLPGGGPGGGASECGGHCKCWLTTGSGRTGFKLPQDEGEGEES